MTQERESAMLRLSSSATMKKWCGRRLYSSRPTMSRKILRIAENKCRHRSPVVELRRRPQQQVYEVKMRAAPIIPHRWARCQELFSISPVLMVCQVFQWVITQIQGKLQKVLDISRPRPARESSFAFLTNRKINLDNYLFLPYYSHIIQKKGKK